jgi:hypothetical protein
MATQNEVDEGRFLMKLLTTTLMPVIAPIGLIVNTQCLKTGAAVHIADFRILLIDVRLAVQAGI